jgi:hypothetical protein
MSQAVQAFSVMQETNISGGSHRLVDTTPDNTTVGILTEAPRVDRNRYQRGKLTARHSALASARHGLKSLPQLALVVCEGHI